jgi:NTE family protein
MTGGPVESKQADVVLEGGGVKGIALVGAVTRLVGAGYTFPRVGGTSAGAVVGAVVAGLQHAGGSLDDLEEIARSLDYSRFRDRSLPGRLLGPLGFLADGVSVLVEDGAYEGHYLENWVSGVLADLGVRTFGDLRRDDPGGDGGIHHRWSLVVCATDVSRRRLARLPWDYDVYGLDPDEQSVASAVRASASIPYFFEPVTLRGAAVEVTLVDGGLISNYPIDLFDREDGRAPRWPTVGVRLDALLAGGNGGNGSPRPVHGPIPLGVALVQSAIEGCQAEHVLAPCNVSRSIFVDTGNIGAVDFGLSEEDEQRLLTAGQQAATAFLATWDFDRWRQECRPVART